MYNNWIVCFKPNPRVRIRLFCFPYAGGGALVFRAWAENLPLEIQVCPIQLPGRENRFKEPPFTQVQPLVQTLLEVFYPYYLTKPFAFFGHSMGALISFELARQLHQQYNLTPVHLFVSARLAPQEVDPRPPIYQLPEDEFVEQLCHLSGTPETILHNAELMQMLLPVLRADFAINEAYMYKPREPLDVPISAFGGLQDPKVSQEDLKKWSEQTSRSFNLHMFPGNHFFINNAQSLVLRAITQELRQFL
jgi:medium-chain acyl-[acyl-carrier-protein] hydrolase